MRYLSQPIRFLDEGEMRRIHQAAVRILGTVGMKIDHDEALDYLRDYGCRADREARRSAVNAIQGRCTIRGA